MIVTVVRLYDAVTIMIFISVLVTLVLTVGSAVTPAEGQQTGQTGTGIGTQGTGAGAGTGTQGTEGVGAGTPTMSKSEVLEYRYVETQSEERASLY